LDIQGNSGTVIRSAIKGKVVKAVNDGGNGWWIAVDELDGIIKKLVVVGGMDIFKVHP
jgi:murein DD-endopeptidase MepM/ murein hydrolase activator NlpD